MKNYFILLALILLVGCATNGVQMKPQTPIQVAHNFCSQATVTVGDLESLADLTPQDEALVHKADGVIAGFCTALGTGTPDLANLNTTVTKVVLGYLSQSTIKNKDQYEIAIIVAQGAVTAFLNNMQMSQTTQ